MIIKKIVGSLGSSIYNLSYDLKEDLFSANGGALDQFGGPISFCMFIKIGEEQLLNPLSYESSNTCCLVFLID